MTSPVRGKSALVVGAGGLGCPALLALAAGGVRRLGIMEPDRVELSNLHRQILYREEDLGAQKAERAREALLRRFPGLEIQLFQAPFAAETHDVVSQFDVVLDGTDHFPTKLALADACVDRGVDLVFGGVVGYEGQVLGVRPGASACPRCLFDEAPPPGAAPTCAELGILGPVAGIVGARQAMTAIALLEGSGEPVLDRLWVYDGRRDRARIVSLRRAGDCRGCGARRHLRGVLAPVEAAPGSLEARVVDLSGLVCPATYTETRRILERLPQEGRVWIHLTSDEAARNVPRSAVAAGHLVLAQLSDGRTHRVLLQRGPVDGHR